MCRIGLVTHINLPTMYILHHSRNLFCVYLEAWLDYAQLCGTNMLRVFMKLQFSNFYVGFLINMFSKVLKNVMATSTEVLFCTEIHRSIYTVYITVYKVLLCICSHYHQTVFYLELSEIRKYYTSLKEANFFQNSYLLISPAND